MSFRVRKSNSKPYLKPKPTTFTQHILLFKILHFKYNRENQIQSWNSLKMSTPGIKATATCPTRFGEIYAGKRLLEQNDGPFLVPQTAINYWVFYWNEHLNQFWQWNITTVSSLGTSLLNQCCLFPLQSSKKPKNFVLIKKWRIRTEQWHAETGS